MANVNLFGEPIVEKGNLREKYNGAPPFSILDAKDGAWQARKRKWSALGIKSEAGRTAKAFHMVYDKWGVGIKTDTSIFDPVLCELMYRWYIPNGGYFRPVCRRKCTGNCSTLSWVSLHRDRHTARTG